jgi:hypothetical protein
MSTPQACENNLLWNEKDVREDARNEFGRKSTPYETLIYSFDRLRAQIRHPAASPALMTGHGEIRTLSVCASMSDPRQFKTYATAAL